MAVCNEAAAETKGVSPIQKRNIYQNQSQEIVNLFGSSPKELIQIKDSRIPGFQDSSAMLKYYEELNVWQKVVYTLFAYL